MSGEPFGVYTNESYQHCGSQIPNVANPVDDRLGLVRSVNTGAPVETSSLRNNREEFWPAFPSKTYIRVLPFGSVVTARLARVWMTAELSDALICVQLAPPSDDRQTPRAYDAA